MASLLDLLNLSVGYKQRRGPDVVVSCDLNLRVEAGEFVCLLGPNGAGKSTLLRTLAGEQRPLAGSVHLDGRDIFAMSKAELAKWISVVLTERVTSTLITVLDLVSMGRIPHTGWLGTLTTKDHEIVAESLDAAGATAFASKRLSDLSDGERQRCMLARALAQQPRLLILDEITAFLDLPRRIEMMHLLQQLAHENQVAVLLSTHDLELALASADRILLQPKLQPLLDAGPEDLVLSGAFESAFASEGLVFDKSSGSFSRARVVRGSVFLEADGIEAYWAQRALERVGLTCTASDDASLAKLRFASGKWCLSRGAEQTSHTSLASALKALVGSGIPGA